MAFQPNVNAFRLSPQEATGQPEYLGSMMQGLQAAYMPAMQQAKIDQMRGAAQKNIMMSRLLQSVMGEGDGEQFGGGNNMKAAVLKAFTGIDPFLMSPQQEQEMKIDTSTKQAAEKANIQTGSSDIAREQLQNVVSLPKEYLGEFASANMLKDRVAAIVGDKAAQERLIQAAVADRLVPEYSGFQLLSQGQRATVPALAHQQAAIRQGWPKALRAINDYLPAELSKEVERRHNKAVRDVNRKREEFLASGGKNRASASPSRSYTWSDISHTAQSRGMSENEVIDRLAKKNNMTVDEFMALVQMEDE